MRIHLAADHAGFELKEKIAEWLQSDGYEVVDHGANTYSPDDDYTDYVFPAAKSVSTNKTDLAIIFGGSGQGEAMAANRIKGVRAFVYYGPMRSTAAVDVTGRLSDDPYEIVKLSRMHNNANVFSVGARFVELESLKAAIKIWIAQEFEQNPRYENRNQKLDTA